MATLNIDHSHPSPNFDERDAGARIDQIIVHYTSMAGPDQVLACFANPESKVSSHYYILECGKIFQLVADEKRAWHAGKSRWQGRSILNNHAIGIELDNRGHRRDYTDYPEAQIQSFIALTHMLQEKHDIMPENILGHSDVASDRKDDPGEKFPWRRLAALGIGIWPDNQPLVAVPQTLDEAYRLIEQRGYDCPTIDTYTDVTQHVLVWRRRKALVAFQRHYAPEDLHHPELLPPLTRHRIACMPHPRPAAPRPQRVATPTMLSCK